MQALQTAYPWTSTPLVACGPMRLIALPSLAVAVSASGGLGFIGCGSDASVTASFLAEARRLCAQHPSLSSASELPVGVGFLLWAGPSLLSTALPAIEEFVPAAVWLFAPHGSSELVEWTTAIRRVTHGRTQVWIQVGTVGDAVEATQRCAPDVLVVQGQDAGGHGLIKGAGLLPLLPEVSDALGGEPAANPRPVLVAAGGIIDGRGAAAALALGADGLALGTRYLAAAEADIARGYRDAVLEARDGGVTTDRGKLYDALRETTGWPDRYGGRGVLNQSWVDAAKGMSLEENKRLYEDAVATGDAGWGPEGRLTTYAGTGVGLVKTVQSAKDITEEVREEAKRFLREASRRFAV